MIVCNDWVKRFLSMVLLLSAFILSVVQLSSPAIAQTGPSTATLSCTPPAAEPEIRALARALNYDVNRIYEYIYYNIAFEPTYGLKKGPLETFLDKTGNNMDQNMLFVSLLRQSCITAQYRFGDAQFLADQFANHIGVDNDAQLINRVLANGGIPNCVRLVDGGACVTSGGAAYDVKITAIWTELTYNGQTYYLDPSLKSYSNYTPISSGDLATAMGYSQSSFMSAADSGSSPVSGLPSGVNSIKNVNRDNIRSKLNQYSENLANYIRTNKPSSSMAAIFGGRIPNNSFYGSSLPWLAGGCTEIGNCTPNTPNYLRTAFTIKVSDSDTSAASVTVTLFADDINGRRVTLLYNSSNQPEIWIDGALYTTGTATTAASQVVTITMTASYLPLPSQEAKVIVGTGGMYSILTGAGDTGRGKLTREQRLLTQALAAGQPQNSEAVRGSGLALVGIAQLSQSSESERIAGALLGYVPVRHASTGVAGYYQSAYLDIPGDLVAYSATHTSTSGAAMTGAFFARAFRGAAIESIAVKQLQLQEAVSTPRMIDYANSGGGGFVQATSGNWSTVKPLLTNWSAVEIARMEGFLTAGVPGRQVITPIDGKKLVNQWNGNGYYLQASSQPPNYIESVTAQISGGFKGGYQTFVNSFYANNVNLLPATNQPQSRTYSWDPIDLQSGYFTYDHDDILVGSAEAPFGLALKRSYNSGSKSRKTALGYGWRHNFMMSVFKDSDPYEGLGGSNPLAAVPFIAATYVTQDILSTSSLSALDTMVASSIAASWWMDQFVDNVVTVETLQGTKRFARIPTAAGGSVYVPPPGDGSSLVTGSGNAATITDKFGSESAFDSDGQITSWKDKNNNTISFTYSGTGVNKTLTSVSNGMGRSLGFTYDGSGQLTSVSDGTRTVNYGYGSGAILTGFTNTLGKTETYSYDAAKRLSQVFHPAFPSTAAATNVYDDFDRVQTQTDALGNQWTYLFAFGYRSQEIDPLGKSRIFYYDANGNVIAQFDQAGERTAFIYDGVGRQAKVTTPNGDSVSFSYDARSNILSKVRSPIPGSIDPLTGNPATPITESWAYNSLSKPTSWTDPRGNVTNYTYDSNGNLTQTVQPSVPYGTGTATPTTTVSYNSRGLPLNVTDPEGKITVNVYDTTTLNLLSVTEDSGSGRLNLVTAYAYDTVGNRVSVTDPNGKTTASDYDSERRLIRTTAPSPLSATKTEYDYNDSGQLTKVRQALGSSWLTTETTYNAAGKPITVTQPDTSMQSTTAYDAVGRPVTVTSSSGRRVRTVYNAKGQIIQIVDEVSGTLDPSITQNLGSVVRETRTYYTGGVLKTLADGKGNTLTYYYDGFRRLKQISFPGGAYDIQAFDESGNRRVLQRRGSVQTWWTYDALNRASTKAPASQATISYAYDRTGRLLAASSSADSSAKVTLGYDTAGRNNSETTSLFATASTFTLDANGNRTSLSLPSGAGSLVSGYTYDALNRVTGVYQGSGTSNRIVGFGYDSANRRISAAYGATGSPPASTASQFTEIGRPSQIGHTWNGSSLTLGYSYNKDGQRKGLSVSDADFLPSGQLSQTTSYTTNALNQYSAVNSTNFTYDARGNLTSDGVWTFGYNSENQLVSASVSGTSVTYGYDAIGRRLYKKVTVGSTTTSTAWLSVGDREYAEYEGVGTATLKTRYVYGAGLDEIVAQIAVNGTRSYVFADALGSTIALTNSSGQTSEKHAYTPYGVDTVSTPGIAGLRFTGRRLDPETGLYYYRGRAYSPALGRFLQTDPIGTQGGINLYAYVGNDPLDLIDPMGLMNVWDTLRLTGGLVEVGAGVAGGLVTSWTGIGGAAGAIAVVHGLDVVQAAWRGTDTFTSQGLQATGLSQNAANSIDLGISGFSGIAAGARIVPYGAAAIAGGTGGTSTISTIARSAISGRVTEDSSAAWQLLTGVYGTTSKGGIVGRIASEAAIGTGLGIEGYSAYKLMSGFK